MRLYLGYPPAYTLVAAAADAVSVLQRQLRAVLWACSFGRDSMVVMGTLATVCNTLGDVVDFTGKAPRLPQVGVSSCT
jgi:hypothetical protein